MFFLKEFTSQVCLILTVGLSMATGVIVRAEQVSAGRAVTLSVTADGTPPFAYQWQKNGVAISGATAAKYSISSMQTSHAGDYTVVVSNSAGRITSPAATLAVQTDSGRPVPPDQNAGGGAITTQPSTQIATVGHEVTFTASGTSGAGQWQFSSDGGSSWINLTNNNQYRGVNTPTLIVSEVSSSLNGARYRFSSGGTTSNAVTLSVAAAFFPFPMGMAADGSGNIYVADASTDTIQKISSSGVVTLLAGVSGQAGTADGSGNGARFNDPSGVSAASDGSLVISDSANGTLRRISANGSVSTLAGSTTNRGNADGVGSAATFSSPAGIGQDSSGNVYVADALNNTIRKVTPSGAVSTLAGSAGVAGNADGSGSSARFNHPSGIAVDRIGNVYVADTMNNTVRKITSSGVVSTLAGLAGISGIQDGAGSGALFNNPSGLVVDSAGAVYVADTGNSTIRRIAPNGVVSTIAGLPGVAGLMDGTGSDAWFNQPKAVALDSNGTLYVADTANATIRKINSGGVVSTVAFFAGETPPQNIPDGNQGGSTGSSSSAGSAGGSSSGSGGGGGAMSPWFALALLSIGWLKRQFGRACPR